VNRVLHTDQACRGAYMCCSVLQCVAVRVAVCCSVLQCVAVCCSVLQCVLQCVAVRVAVRYTYR